MKKILLTILPLLLIVGCSKVEGKQDLIPVVETYKNGNIESITYHKKSRTGIEKVKYEGYNRDGQKKEERTYKDGIEDGLRTTWYWDGRKCSEETYKDGKRDGKWTEWSGGETFNGESPSPVGIFRPYHKRFEKTFKDGKQDGQQTYWWDNGQKEMELTYKNGKFISSKKWYRDGTEQ